MVYEYVYVVLVSGRYSDGCQDNTTTTLRPFVQDYLGEPVPEETLTHPPS